MIFTSTTNLNEHTNFQVIFNNWYRILHSTVYRIGGRFKTTTVPVPVLSDLRNDPDPVEDGPITDECALFCEEDDSVAEKKRFMIES